MEIAKNIDGKKFMWDGVVYEKEEEARSAMERYISDGFETRMIREDDSFFLFTRRIVTEVKVEGAPPI